MAKKNPLQMAKAIAKFDGWTNIFTGLGIRGKDRRKASKIEWELMTENDADEMYAASDIARKVVEEVVNDSFREGYELKADEINPKTADGITDEKKRLQIDEKLAEAWILARMYGGSAIIPIPKDINLLKKPFVPESISRIENLLVLSRWELPRQSIETDVRKPGFAQPTSYRLCPRSGAAQMDDEVHQSWLLRFDGSYLPRIKFFQNNLWHDSILNVCKTPIRDYDAALASLSATLDDFSVGVLKMKDLSRSISEDKDDLITKRLEITNLSRSVAKMIIIDSDNEDFAYQDRQLAGVADAVRMIAGRLVVASNMPHTKILGESPEGSNATGNSTTKDWYDHVGAQQTKYLDPRLLTLWAWIFAQKKGPTGGVVPKGLHSLYNPLWQEPDSVQATTRYQQAQTDQIYITNAVVDPAEVAVSRFGSGKYSTDTQLLDGRAEELARGVNSVEEKKNEQAEAVAAAQNPDPNADPEEDDSGENPKNQKNQKDPKDKKKPVKKGGKK